MEDDSQTSAGEVPLKMQDVEVNGDEEDMLKSNLQLQRKEGSKEEEEETALDGDFIKIEKESLDVKDSSFIKKSVAVEEQPSAKEINSVKSISSSEWEGAQEKINELKLKLDAVCGELATSESEKTGLKTEAEVAKERFKGSEKQYQVLELDLKKLKDEAEESELKYNLQLQSLQEALNAQECKYKELANVKEAFDGLSIELESSRKKMEKLEFDLVSSAEEARKYEELSKEKDSHAEMEVKKATELEKLLEVAKLSEEELKDKISLLQEELKGLHDKIGDDQHVKDALNSTKVELSAAREELSVTVLRVAELEQQLNSEAAIVGELNRELSISKASSELEVKKALEFEKMLEGAKLREEEMEDKMAALQEELNVLHDKVADNQQVKEVLDSTRAELSTAQEELGVSKKLVLELEKKIASGGAIIEELNRELSLSKSSEELARRDLSALEKLFSDFKEEYQAKVVSLQEFELKYSEKLKAMEAVETSLRNQEAQILTLQEELVKVTGEKESLFALTEERESNFLQAKEMCILLENKLSLSEQNFEKTGSLLSQALSEKSELGEKLRSLKELHEESSVRAETASQRNLELEEMIQTSNVAQVEVKALLKETELKLVSMLKKNEETEQQLNLAKLKCSDKDQELEELREKISELTASLKAYEEDKEFSRCHLQAYEDRVSQLESSLSLVTKRKSELELQLKDLEEKSSEHENRVNISQQRSLELEDLIQVSHFKSKDAEDRAAELELQLEATRQKVQELEEQLRVVGIRHKDAEAEKEQINGNISVISAELEAFRERSSSLEIALQAASEKERELADLLSMATEEKNKLDTFSRISTEKVLEMEKLLEVLQNELKLAKDKLQGAEKDLEESGIRENEILDQLKSAEEKLECQSRTIEEATARNSELESLLESLSKSSELKLQETLAELSQNNSEAEKLSEKLNFLEEQVTLYRDQAAEATESVASMKAQLEASSVTQVSFQNCINELKRRVEEAENIAEQSCLEKEAVTSTNSKLKVEVEVHQVKVNELQEMLASIRAEEKATADQLASHVKTISDLTGEHSQVLELQLATQSYAKETEAKLQETIERLRLRDLETNDLNEKLLSLEILSKMHKEQATEANNVAESRKVELEETSLKLKRLEGVAEEFQQKCDQFAIENEGLAKANLKQTHEMVKYENELNELQTRLNEVLAEKEETIGQLHSSRKTIDDLSQQLASEGERLQSQISSVIEENNLLNEMHQNTKKELTVVIAGLEGEIKEQKKKDSYLNDQIASLKADIILKSGLEARISELEQQLLSVETKYKEEIESIRAEATEKEEELSSKLVETICKLKEKDSLEDQLAQLQKELHIAQIAIAEQKEADTSKELERDAATKQSLKEFEAKCQHVFLLEKQVQELEQKLQVAESQYKEKDIKGKSHAVLNSELAELKNKLSQTDELEKKVAELENEVQLAKSKSAKQMEVEIVEAEVKEGEKMKSRDFTLGAAMPLKRKSKKRSEGFQQPSEISNGNPIATAEEPSLWMTLKFMTAIALVSIIFGIILGKRY